MKISVLKTGWLLLFLLLAGLLCACGDDTTAVAASPTDAAPLVIPTFTPAPEVVIAGTPTPTPIVVGPTDPPTVTPVPTATPVPTTTPTATPLPVPTLPPTPTLPANGALHDITAEQARNFNGYHALLPAYLPAGFTLTRLSGGTIQGSSVIVLLAEYADKAGNSFYFNTQALPGITTNVVATATPFPTLAITASGATVPPTSTPFPTFTPRPTVATSQFGQETVTVRGQPALLSYDNLQASLSWSEGTTQYSLNGNISKDEIVKVAQSLK